MPSLIRGAHNLSAQHRPSVVTIGSFDGVHRGHQVLLEQLKAAAHELSLPAVVVIFEPQPREYFAPEQAAARLQPLRDKVLSLWGEGVDTICCLPFNRALSSLSAETFVERVLVRGLGVKHLIIGDDFRFGCNREGDRQLLQDLGQQQGFNLSSANTVLDGGERISSSRIRQALAEGDCAEAARLLGRPFSVSGRVVYGKQLGRTLGFPTANIQMRRQVSPVTGVFAVSAQLAGDERLYRGVANVGFRPTVENDTQAVLETYLFDFDGDLYGRRVSVQFERKIRDEKKFSSVDELQQQIQRDIAEAKREPL